jgi:hypothetical protein
MHVHKMFNRTVTCLSKTFICTKWLTALSDKVVDYGHNELQSVPDRMIRIEGWCVELPNEVFAYIPVVPVCMCTVVTSAAIRGRNVPIG